MSKRTYTLKKCKFEKATDEDQIFVGLDVHKKSIHIAVRINGKLIAAWVTSPGVRGVIAAMEPLRPGMKKVVYEAGPTGYSLARAMKKEGWPIEVVAPGKIPKEANTGSKSDRLDCRKLAEYAEKDLLKAIAIPTEQEEADRQMVRLRDQLTKKQRRAKQQIKGFLLQHGIDEPVGLSGWTKQSITALQDMELRPELRFVLDALLEELKYLIQSVQRVEQQILQMAKEDRYWEKEARLETHPGVGFRTAMKFLTEIYQPDRFSEGRQVACYVGTAPLVRESGEKRREGPTIKAGQGELRRMLVQASWVWIRRDPQAASVYRRLVRNSGCSQKAIIGMARRMAVNLWCMLTREENFQFAA